MAIRYFLIFLSCIIFIKCNQRVTETTQHKFKINFIKNFKEDESKIADSNFRKLIPKFREVYYNDQLYRDVYSEKYYQKNYLKQNKLDLENQKFVYDFIRKNGILAKEDIGFLGSKAISVVLMHSPLDSQKTVLNEVTKALQDKKIEPTVYAILIDKINFHERKFQIYGTQIATYKGEKTFYPIDLVNLQMRRDSIGLRQDYKNYLKTFFNSDFDSLEYLKKLPELIEFYKIK